MIRVEHVSRRYTLGKLAVDALRDVSFDIAAGDMACIMGRSGSGKSTLLRQLSLIDKPTEENVFLPAMMRGSSVRDYRQRAQMLLEMVGLGSRIRHQPKELSGGEQQRVAIARALVNEPKVIYADEPTANLDSISGRTVMQTLMDLNKNLGVTILFVSHDPDDAKYAGRLIHLTDGVLAADGVA